MTTKQDNHIATRTTADGIVVLFHPDGCITNRLGGYPRGTTGKLPVAYLWTLAGEIGLYDWAELPTVLRATRKLAKRLPSPPQPGDYRAAMGEALKASQATP